MELSLAQLIGLFHQYNTSIKKSEKTKEWHKYALASFVTYIGNDLAISQINKQTVTGYRLHLVESGLADHSVNNKLSSLRALLNWAVEEDYMLKAPKIRLVRLENQRPKETFTPAQFNDFLSALVATEKTVLLQTRLKALCLVLFDTGIRIGELCSAKITDVAHINVDGEMGHVLNISGAKRGGYRQVVLSQRAWKAIADYRQELAHPHGRSRRLRGTSPVWLFTSSKGLDAPLLPNGVRQIFRRALKQLEDSPLESVRLNPHVFRRAFAAHWLNASEGQELDSLMTLGGWKDITTVKKHYAAYKTATLVKTHRRLSPLALLDEPGKVLKYEEAS